MSGRHRVESITLSLGASGGARFIEMSVFRFAGLKLEAANSTAVGTIYFRLANSAVDSAPNAMTSPTVAVAAGTAINEFVELVDLCGDYLEVYWDASTTEAVDMTITASLKE